MKKFDTNAHTRSIKDQLYLEWQKDPIAFQEMAKREAKKFKDEYFTWKNQRDSGKVAVT